MPKKALLHGNLQEVHMDSPPDFVVKGHEGKVVPIKALYGLKQSPCAWFDRFSKALIRFGYKRCCADHTMFVKRNGDKVAMSIVFVEDM